MKFTHIRVHTALTTFMACLLLLLFLPAESTAQTNPNAFISNEVAYVNGEVLTEPAFLFTVIRMYGEEIFYDLIEDEVIAGQASAMGVSLEDSNISEYLANAYTPEKLSALLDGFSEDVLEYTVGTQLLALKIVTLKIDQLVTEHNIVVTDEQVQDTYFNNLPLWTTPKSVRFSMIETETEAEVNSARARIVAGEDFADVCLEVSTHPGTRAYGGDIGGLVPEGYSTDERVLIEDTAFDLEVGELSGPILVNGMYYIIKTTEKTEYSEPTLDEMYDYLHAGMLDQLVQPFLEEWMMSLMAQTENSIEITYPIYSDNLPASFVPGADGSFIAPSIATVNNREIPESALLFHLLRQYGSSTIESLIEEILFVEQAGTMGVGVTEAETRQSLLDVYNEDRLSILDAAFGTDVITGTLQQHLTALDVLGSKYQQIIEEHDIEITDDEILQYYLDNLHLWTRPESVRFSMIVVETEEEAVAARERIVTGESFESVCMDVSTHDATRIYGGDIGDMVPRGVASGENEVMLDTAFDLPIGGVSQPFLVGSSWFLIKTTEKYDSYEPTLAEMREEITGELLDDRVTPFIMGWRSTLWTEADIEVVYPIYSDTASPDFMN